MSTSNDQTKVTKGLALVVDDLLANRKILQSLLKLEGYQTIAAEDGRQAVQLYTEHQPDIIFMDVMMPVMDGYQATAEIKALSGTQFIPVIFLSALSESDAMVKCIEAGGDDFLSKPYKQEILRAKIRAMERIRNLTRKVIEQHHEIQRQHNFLLKEQVLAEQIYTRAVTADNIPSKYIKSILRAMTIFSGDMLLTADCPDGKLHILLGDFTGHGLNAAVGVLPVAEVFRAMTAKGFSAAEILSAINSKLNRLLPTGMFMTACFVVVEEDLHSVTIWNAGMPEALVLGADDGQSRVLKHRIVSQYLPLGIIDKMDTQLAPVSLPINKGDCVLLCSDGLSDAVNASGEEFGLARYERAATSAQGSFQAVVTALETFCGGQPFNDDVSFVEIQCLPGLLKTGTVQNNP